MLKHRLITGPLLVLMFLGVIWLDDWLDTYALSGVWQDIFLGRTHPPRGLVLFIFCVLIPAPLAAIELANMCKLQNIATNRELMVFAAMLGLILSYSIPQSTQAVTAIAIVSTGMVVVFVASLLTFSANRNVQGVIAAAGAVMFAMVYIGLMMGFFLAIRRDHSAWWIVGIVLTTKMADSGAYFTGRAIGRHKLAPWLSPGKTWEGFVGGILGSMLTGAIIAWMSHWLPDEGDHVPVWLAVIWGAVFGLVGQFGDLMKSLLKRGAGIKDSSALLPGLGGVLDVLDSPLMVAPVAFWLIVLTYP